MLKACIALLTLMIFNAFHCQETEEKNNFIYKLVHLIILNFCEKVQISCK